MQFSTPEQDTIPQNVLPSRGASETHVVPSRFGLSIMYCLMGVIALFAMADALVSHWQEQEIILSFIILMCAGVFIWVGAGYAMQFERMIRKGYAMKMDRQGLHHFNLPSIPWEDLGSAVIEVIETNNRKRTYLCLGVNGHTQMLIAGSQWWSNFAGWEVKRHESGRAIMMPCDQIDEEPNRLAHLINRRIRESQGQRS